MVGAGDEELVVGGWGGEEPTPASTGSTQGSGLPGGVGNAWGSCGKGVVRRVQAPPVPTA